jgi:tRNA-modifying protein YgfZ
VATAVDAALAAPPGTAASAIAAGPGGPVAAVAFESGTVVLHARRRSRQPSLDVHALARDAEVLAERLARAGARLAGEVALAAGRIDAAIGASAAEGVDALPQEAGLEGRISYRKGCYLGQEIMARIEGRGTLRRGLARLELESAPAHASEREVRDEAGRAVGRVGTAAWTPAGWAALAVLRLDLSPGAPLRTLGVAARLAAWPQPS